MPFTSIGSNCLSIIIRSLVSSFLLQGILFAAHAILATAFAAGMALPLTAPLLYVSTFAMHGRQEWLLDVSDQVSGREVMFQPLLLDHLSSFPNTKLLRNLLFWWMWLTPQIWRRVDTTFVTNTPALALVVQLVLMHLGHLCQREVGDSRQYWHDGSALYYLLAGSLGIRSHAARWVLSQPVSLVRVLTWATAAFDLVAPAVIVLTTVQQRLRGVLLAVLAVLHVAFYTLIVYMPQWALLWPIAAVPLVPSAWMDVLWPYVNGDDEKKKEREKKEEKEKVEEDGKKVAENKASVKTKNDNEQAVRRRLAAPTTTAPQTTATTATSPPTTPSTSQRPSLLSRYCAAMALAFALFMVMDWAVSDAHLYTPSRPLLMARRYVGVGQGWMPLRPAWPEARHTWASAEVILPAHDAETHIDVLRALSDGDWRRNMTESEVTALSRRPECPSCRYPTWRYERFLHVASLSDMQVASVRAGQLAEHWCQFVENAFAEESESDAWRKALIRVRLARYTVLSDPGQDLKYSDDQIVVDVTRKCWPEAFIDKKKKEDVEVIEEVEGGEEGR